VGPLRASRPPGGGVPSDRDALAGLRAGDAEIFDVLVRRWSGAMLRLALARVDSRAEPEEALLGR
jgi:hypothetical protein